MTPAGGTSGPGAGAAAAVLDRAAPPRTAGRAGLRHVVAVAAGKGGVGASTVAALLAMGVAVTGRTVLLVDADPNFGTLHLMLGADPGDGLPALRRPGVTPRDLVQTVDEGLHLVPASGGGPGGDAPAPAERGALLRRLRPLYEEAELVVVDVGSRLSSVKTAARAGVGRMVAVTEGGRVSVAATYALLKAVERRRPGLPVEVVANRRSEREARGPLRTLRDASRHFLSRPVGITAPVPADPRLRETLEEGRSLLEASHASPAAEAAFHLGQRLMREVGTGARDGSGPRRTGGKG